MFSVSSFFTTVSNNKQYDYDKICKRFLKIKKYEQQYTAHTTLAITIKAYRYLLFS